MCVDPRNRRGGLATGNSNEQTQNRLYSVGRGGDATVEPELMDEEVDCDHQHLVTMMDARTAILKLGRVLGRRRVLPYTHIVFRIL